MKTIILGSGFTGLASGIKTGGVIYEATGHPGGICRDYEKDGFKFSNGGPHWIFGKDAGLDYIKTLVEVKEYEANAGVFFNHIFPYPIQSELQKTHLFNNIPGLPMAFHHYHNFGKELYNLFFEPFNEKYTAGLYGEVIQQDAYKTPIDGKRWVTTFWDPVNGLSDLVNKMADKCTIMYHNPALSIDTHNKIVKFKYGHEKYDRLISTIPLNKCLEMCGNTDFKLPYTSVLVINIGAERGHSTPDEHWLYIPFCKSGFHRVSFYTNVDPTKAPDGKVGLSVEIAYRSEEQNIDWAKEINLMENIVINELKNWGWIGDVITTQSDFVKTAYTWMYKKEDRENALNWLSERDIISTGRYGKWKFQGLTASIMDGFNVQV